MSDVSSWSPVASNNNAASPDGFPEGQSAGSLNDSGREVMAGLRRHLEDFGWFNGGYTPSFISFTAGVLTFSVAAPDRTAHFEVGRRVRIVGSTTGTVYGTIASSAFSSITTVTVNTDSGTVANESLTISVGAGVAGAPSGLQPIEVGMKFLCRMAALPSNGLWTLDTTDDDVVPIIRDSFDDSTGGSWSITGLTGGVTGASGSLTLAVAATGTATGFTNAGGATIQGGSDVVSLHQHAVSVTGLATGGTHQHSAGAISSNGAWRPAHRNVVVLEYTG